jgi:hypothetical protein
VDKPHQLAVLPFVSRLWRDVAMPLVRRTYGSGDKLPAPISRDHVGVVRWLSTSECALGETLCESAAQHGHLTVLQWARENGAPWDEETCNGAALGGHLDVLQWTRRNGAPWDGKNAERLRSRVAITSWPTG